MKKSVKIRVICLITAALMLGSAMTVAAFLGSPYETLKKSLLDALTTRNVTEEGRFTLSVNGVVLEETKFHNIQGDDRFLNYYYYLNGDIEGFHYSTNGLSIYSTEALMWGDIDRDTEWYSADVHPEYDYYPFRGSRFSMFNPDDRNSAQMRFMELLADALVGDLKNNITMTSENGNRYISGTLTETQVPELAKAGIDMLVEQSSRYYGNFRDVSFNGSEYVFERISIERGMKTVSRWEKNVRAMTPEESEAWEDGTFFINNDYDFWGTVDIDGNTYFAEGPERLVNEYKAPATRADYGTRDNPFELPMQSIVVNYIHGEAEVDMDGNLLYVDASGTLTVTNIFGEVSVVELKATIRFSDIGTSDPDCPIPGAEQLLTPDYVKTHFGSSAMNVYFSLNEDGSIDAGSITTKHPSESAKLHYSNNVVASNDMESFPSVVDEVAEEPELSDMESFPSVEDEVAEEPEFEEHEDHQ